MKNPIQKIVVLALGLTALTLSASIFTGPPTTGGGGSITTPVSIANGGTGQTTARDAGTAVGVFQMSPAGGNDAFADEQAATPNFADQFGFSAYGSQLEYMWWATGTSQSNWSGSFALPGHIEVGDPTHMLTNDVHENTFVANGVPLPTGLSVPSDNVIRLINEHPAHFSAMAWNSSATDGLGERGAIGYGNGGASIYANINYLEDFGGDSGFYFVTAAGGLSFGMEKTSTDLVKFGSGAVLSNGYAASNVVFRVKTSTGAMTNLGPFTTGGIITAGSAAQQITLAAGNLNAGAFSASDSGTLNHTAGDMIAMQYRSVAGTLTKPQFDLFGNGTGIAGTNSDFAVSTVIAGVRVGKFTTTTFDVQVPTATFSNIVVTNLASITSANIGTLVITNGYTNAINALTNDTRVLTFTNTNSVVVFGNITATNLTAITTTNDNAAAGYLGQFISSLVASGSAVSLTTATASNVTSISLTAGDWDVEGNVNFSETTSTVTARSAGISTTTGTLPTDGSEVPNGVQSTVTSEVNGISLPRKRVSIASTTTVYLVGKATFSAGTCVGYGQINARRVR